MAMITTALRNIIGTALLSFAVAQQILNSITGKRSKKELAVANIIKAHQKKLALKIASCLVAVSIFASCFTVLTLTDWGRVFRRKVTDSVKETVETITEYYYYYNDDSSNEDGSESESDDGFFENLFGTDSSSREENSSDSNVSSPSFWQNLFGSDDENSSYETESEQDASSKNNTHQTESETSSDATVSENESSADNPQTSTFESNTSDEISSNTTPTLDLSHSKEVGNYYSNANVAQKGDWIYYCSNGVNEDGGNSPSAVKNIYKVKKDGTQKQIIKNDIQGDGGSFYLNVVGDWIYYLEVSWKSCGKVYRLHTDGSGYELIAEVQDATRLQVIDNIGIVTTYKYDSDTETSTKAVYKLDLTTGEKTQLPNITSFYITESYYAFHSGGNLCFYSIKDEKLIHTLSGYGLSKSYGDNVILLFNGEYYHCNLNTTQLKPKKILADGVFVEFYSTYAGGCVGGHIARLNNGDKIEKCVVFMSDLSYIPYSFKWNCGSNSAPYASFDDGYVYYVQGETLHRAYPDGSDYAKLG